MYVTLASRPAVPEPAEPVLTSNPAVLAVVEQCERLAGSIGCLKQQSPLSSSSDTVHPRECVPPSIQEEIICWLGGLSLVREKAYGEECTRGEERGTGEACERRVNKK